MQKDKVNGGAREGGLDQKRYIIPPPIIIKFI